MELLILLALIVLNGVFAMSELAVVSARRALLQERADRGDRAAQTAIDLAEDPDRFLSTVQVGITLIGIVAGAYGGASIAQDIADAIRVSVPALADQADTLGFGLIVLLTTYLSLVIGELVPKRIALNNAEAVARRVAPVMRTLSRGAAPLVWFLSQSTELVSRILRIRDEDESVSDMEVIALVQEGVQSGDFAPSEYAMVRGALELDDMRIRDLMTPRVDMVWLDLDDPAEDLAAALSRHRLPFYPVVKGRVDNVAGMVYAPDLLAQALSGAPLNLALLMQEPLFIPETAMASQGLHTLHRSDQTAALVIDEHGGIEGIISEQAIAEEVVGSVDGSQPRPARRTDGSWLFDGSFPVDTLADYVPAFHALEDAESLGYSTLAGFVLAQMKRIPQAADSFTWEGLRVEVVDMDGRRIDKVLITPPDVPPPGDA